MNGMTATRVKRMASMRVTAKRAKGEYYMYVRSIEVVASQRTTRAYISFHRIFSRVDIFFATHKHERERCV